MRRNDKAMLYMLASGACYGASVAIALLGYLVVPTRTVAAFALALWFWGLMLSGFALLAGDEAREGAGGPS